MTRFYCDASTCKYYEMPYTSRPKDEGNCTREDTQLINGVCREREDVDSSKLLWCSRTKCTAKGETGVCYHQHPHKELDDCTTIICKYNKDLKAKCKKFIGGSK